MARPLKTTTLVADLIADELRAHPDMKPGDLATAIIVTLTLKGIKLTASKDTREHLTKKWLDGLKDRATATEATS